MDIRVKICGLTRPSDMEATASAGAAYAGFNFIAKSVRCLTAETAAALAAQAPPGLCKVALTMDADDATLDAILMRVPIDMLQLHGHETPERVSALKARHGLPVMKAVGVATEDDLPKLDVFGKVADQLLVDSKAAPGTALLGGTGIAFDWRLIAGRRWPVPWMLAGGLTQDNVAEAIRLTGARQIDVASGVESSPGVKDPARIAAFVSAAHGAHA